VAVRLTRRRRRSYRCIARLPMAAPVAGRRSPTADGRANDALLRLLAKNGAFPRRDVTISTARRAAPNCAGRGILPACYRVWRTACERCPTVTDSAAS